MDIGTNPIEPPAMRVIPGSICTTHNLKIKKPPRDNLKQNPLFGHLTVILTMPSEPYSGFTNSPIAKDTTIFIGIVVRGTLIVDVLKNKATELIERWPALGGKFVTKVINWG